MFQVIKRFINKNLIESFMADIDIIVKSKIKEAVKELNIAAEVSEALNKKVIDLLSDAAERAKANGRRTLQARDL